MCDLPGSTFNSFLSSLLSPSPGPVEYKPEMPEGDPKALFQQQIPKSFLDLQVDIRKTIAEYRKQNRTPILNEDEFRYELVHMYLIAYMCVRACVHACVCACVRACVCDITVLCVHV